MRPGTSIGTAVAAVGGAGSVAAAVLGSPVPALVAGGLLGVLILTVAIVALTAACSRERHEPAYRVLDRLLAAVPGSRTADSSTVPPASTPTAGSARHPGDGGRSNRRRRARTV